MIKEEAGFWFLIDCDSVKWIWDDFGCAFICPCGKEVVLTEPGETKDCGCGRSYKLQAYVEMTATENLKPN